MKNMNVIKRLASISAALVMAATSTMALAAFAETVDTGKTLTITTSDENQAVHTYAAYQVFKGTYSDGVLTDITWGDGVPTNILDTVKEIDIGTADTPNKPFAGCTEAADVAKILGADGNNTNDSTLAKAFAKAIGDNVTTTTSGNFTAGSVGENGAVTAPTISGLADGYYLVKDNGKAGTDNAISRYMLAQVGGDTNVTLTVKSDIAKVEKKVYEGNAWQDVADAAIGDTVKFRLVATLPSNYDDYKAFYLNFKDSLSEGFDTVDANNVKYYKIVNDGTPMELSETESANFTATVTDKANMTFECLDLKQIVSELGKTDNDLNKVEIVVEYEAKLNDGAKVTPTTGNDNEVTLEYSNNPNSDYDGTTKPDNPGETPKDKVRTLTYEFDGTKLDKDNTTKKLANAEFLLSRVKTPAVMDEDGTTVVTPAVIEYATVKVDDTDAFKFTITGWTETKPTAGNIKSDSNGKFNIIGLDDGTYSLEETKAPVGYNLPSSAFPLTVTSTFIDGANGVNGDDITYGTDTNPLDELAVTFGDDTTATGNKETGIVTGTVLNAKGTALPSTGGIGTKIFFAGGGTLVLGAGVTLIAKKRMKNKE